MGNGLNQFLHPLQVLTSLLLLLWLNLILSQCEKGKEPILIPTELVLQLQVEALTTGYCILDAVPHWIWRFLAWFQTTLVVDDLHLTTLDLYDGLLYSIGFVQGLDIQIANWKQVSPFSGWLQCWCLQVDMVGVRCSVNQAVDLWKECGWNGCLWEVEGLSCSVCESWSDLVQL